MQTRSRLIKHKQGFLFGGSFYKERCQLDTLRLTTRKGRGRLTQLYITQTNIL